MNALDEMREQGKFVGGRGASWLLGENDWGDLYVPSITQRIKHGEPWWAKSFDPRKPWHWPFYLWTRLRGGLAMIESQ